ncbi:hypothetical protein J3458_011786 [Metarhizium acridum]|uniref:uncharacterized protein n=1 Tax=Metarhizium acridum TaxID=92637 RepID=UPI001C6C880F|nr:hypothetical protein J3458_011786 [Metarhizium acridum]
MANARGVGFDGDAGLLTGSRIFLCVFWLATKAGNSRVCPVAVGTSKVNGSDKSAWPRNPARIADKKDWTPLLSGILFLSSFHVSLSFVVKSLSLQRHSLFVTAYIPR